MSGTTELHVADNPSLDHQTDPPEAPIDNKERQLTPRERMMAEIVARAQGNREHEEELGATYDREARERGEVFTDEPEAPPEPPQAAAPEPAPEQTLAAPEAPQPAPQPALRTVSINGQPWSVTAEQYDQLAHIGAVASVAMSQAPIAPPQAPQPAPAQRPLVDEARLRDAVQKMQFGSQEEGAAALGSLIEHVVSNVPPAPAIDRDQIITAASQRALEQAQLQRDTDAIRSEFPKIYTDPRLAAMAHHTVVALAQQDAALGRSRRAIDIYREAGQQVYDLIGQPRPGSDAQTVTAPQAAPTIQPRAGVEERKRAAPRNPQPVDRRAAQPAAAPRPPTGAEIVAQMRQQRGQAPLS